MKDDDFSNRLNFVLDEEGFPPKNRGRIQLLADLVELSHRGASKWINGESCPPAKKFAEIAKKLKVNEAWLKTGKGFMRESQEPTEECTLSMFAREPQEVPVFSNKQFLAKNKYPQKRMHCYLPWKGEFFGVIHQSESMSPRFPTDSVLIFDSNPKIRDGDFVLANCPAWPEPVFRQVLISGTTRYLHALNPKFDRLVMGSEDAILGRLVQAVCSFPD